MQSVRRRTRSLAAVTAGLVLALASTGPSAAGGPQGLQGPPPVVQDQTPARPLTDAAAGFSDVGVDHPFYDDITWMRTAGITTGYADGTFRGSWSVNRDAMAAFLHRVATGQTDAPGCTAAPFSDVPVTHPFCGEIAWLAESGVTTGYPDGSFRPGLSVSREAMAAFLYRLHTGEDAAAPCSVTPFADVSIGHPFCGEIAWLADTEISGGWPDGTFRPGIGIERQAMARFLHRLDGLPSPEPPGLRVEVVDLPDGVAADVVLTAPDGTETPLAASTELPDPAAGAWTASARDVGAEPPGLGTATFAPTVTPASVTVGPDSGGTVTVSYFTVVAEETVVLPEGTVLAVDREVSPTSVLLAAGTDAEVGDILVSDVTAAAPYGMIVRVTALTGADPIVAMVEPATITDAVPRGRLVANAAFTADTLVTPVEPTTRAGAVGADLQAAGGGNPIRDAISDNFECEFEGDDIEFDSELEFQGGLDLDVEWGRFFWSGLDSAELSGYVEQYAELVFEAELEFGCALEEIDLLPRPWRMGTFTVFIGFVPIVIVPEVQLYLDGSFEVSGRIVTGVTESFEASAGIRYDDGGFSAVGEEPELETTFLAPQPQLAAEAEAGVRAELRMQLYGAAGPYVSARPGLSFEADVLDDPWWELYATLGVSAGLLAEALDWEYETGEFIELRMLLAEAAEEPEYVDYGEVPYQMLGGGIGGDDGEAPAGQVTMHLEPGQIGRMTCTTGGRDNGNGQWGNPWFTREAAAGNDAVTILVSTPSGESRTALRSGSDGPEGVMLGWEDATVLVMPNGETTDVVAHCGVWYVL